MTPDKAKDRTAATESEADAARVSPNFLVEVTVSASGYVTVEAADENSARREVERMRVSIDWPRFSNVDTSLFDGCGADVHVDGITLDDESEAPNAQAG